MYALYDTCIYLFSIPSFITSGKKVIFFIDVCLFVSGITENYLTDFHKIRWKAAHGRND